jgi:hypothetical protein
VKLSRVYPPTARSVARALAGGSPVLVVYAGAPCVLHTVDERGDFRAARFETCVASSLSVAPREVRYMFGFWSPRAPAEPEAPAG